MMHLALLIEGGITVAANCVLKAAEGKGEHTFRTGGLPTGTNLLIVSSAISLAIVVCFCV